MAYDPKLGGNVFQTTGTPAATVGSNGDYAIDTTTAGGPYIYGPKASGTWPSAMGLGGAAGTPGNLYLPLVKSANYSMVAGDLTGPTPAYVFDCSGGSLAFSTDATLLWNSSNSQSRVAVLKRFEATAANTLTINAASGQTIDGLSSVVLPISKVARRLFAISPTAMLLE